MLDKASRHIWILSPLAADTDSALEGGIGGREILKLGGHPDADMRQSWHKLE